MTTSSSSTAAPAYVLWFGPTGLSVARALGREGISVVAAHHDVNEPSLDTKYARTVVLPALEADEQAWLDWLLAEGRENSPTRAVLIPTSDAHWLLVARHRAQLEPYFRFAIPEHGEPEQWIGKPMQYEAAMRAGVPCPATFRCDTLEALERAAERAVFPCLVKPVLSHLWQLEYGSKLAFARTPEELRRTGGDALSRGIAMMIQEYIPAPDNEIYGVFMCVDRLSRPLGVCVARKQRQHEPRFGNSCMSVCVDEPQAVELGLRLAKELGYRGIASAEFKRDPRDGEFKLMEINLRPTTLMGLAADNGVNLPLLLYRDLLDDSPPQKDAPPVATPKRFGKRVGNFAQDFRVARFYRKHEGLSRLRWLWTWLRTRDIYFAWDDLGPFRGHFHTFIDHLRSGRYRGFPHNFPTPEEWRAGRWDGTRLSTGHHEFRLSTASAPTPIESPETVHEMTQDCPPSSPTSSVR